ncbi:Protein-export membrane protein SecD [uncultured archaeon]|nr:Protein-export membrane protein SecD [uncultured archaeon]
MKINFTFRIWLLIIILICSAIIISPNFQKGVIIKSVEKNSTAFEQGLKPNMIISSINGKTVNNMQDYTTEISSIFPTKNKTSVKIGTDSGEIIIFTNTVPEITVSDVPKSKIKTGLDLSGGARALVKAENKSLSSSELDDLIAITSNRLNEFGIADVSVKPVSDLSGSNFMQIEVAGASSADLNDLVSQQGKFEAKIGNETVFIGGKEDITYVARTGDQAGIYSCDTYQGQELCSFRFAITLSEAAAERQAKITSNLSLDSSNSEYLSKKLELYLDDNLVDSLSISKDLKGRVTTQISIQGSGKGATREEAYNDAMNNMKKLQTILITGSLPYKLEIVKIDTISPVLGKEFTKNILLLALLVFVLVSGMLFLKFRKIKITLAVILTMFSEAFITLAIAALIKWNLDAPSIAGIIAGMGTGIDDQIVILDEASSDNKSSLKERIKNAFFVIMSAFSLTVVAMLPLFWAGAGMLKGFALTTIIGVSVGVLITRPAFADIVKYIMKE